MKTNRIDKLSKRKTFYDKKKVWEMIEEKKKKCSLPEKSPQTTRSKGLLIQSMMKE